MKPNDISSIKKEELGYVVDNEGILHACKDEYIVASFNDRLKRWNARPNFDFVPFGSRVVSEEEMLKRTDNKYPDLYELTKWGVDLNKIMFEMSGMIGKYQFFASIDNDDIVEYEFIDHTFSKYNPRRNKSNLDKRKSRIFIDLIEKANIIEIPFQIENSDKNIDWIRTDIPSYSITSFKYGNAKWNADEEIDNVFYIYLAIAMCDAMGLDDSMFSSLISNRAFDDESTNFVRRGQFRGKLICYSFDWTNFPSDANPYDSYITNVFNKEDEVGKKMENIFKTQIFNSDTDFEFGDYVPSLDGTDDTCWYATLVNDSYEIFQYYGKHGENKLIDELIEHLNSHDYPNMVN